MESEWKYELENEVFVSKTFTDNAKYKVYRNKAGQLHNENGPAILKVGVNSSKWALWYQNGLLHRTDGPARFQHNRIEWYQNGLLHRTDGPAVTYNDKEYYYVNGVKVKQSEMKYIERNQKINDIFK